MERKNDPHREKFSHDMSNTLYHALGRFAQAIVTLGFAVGGGYGGDFIASHYKVENLPYVMIPMGAILGGILGFTSAQAVLDRISDQ